MSDQPRSGPTQSDAEAAVRTLIEWAAAKIQAFRWMQKPVADEQLAQMIEHATSPDCSAANLPILDPRFAA